MDRAPRRRIPALLARMLAPHLATGFALAAAAFPSPAAAQVAVFPTPGSSYNLPGTQISLRGVDPGQVGPVLVAGSSTGQHNGRLEPDSDGQGASFVPDTPFAPGETVTVTTQLDLAGTSGGSYSFAIAHTAGAIAAAGLPLVRPRPGGVARFHSRPDLRPAAVAVTEDKAPASPGDIFLAPQNGPDQNGPMILDPEGRLVWFWPYPVSTNTLVTDFRVQRLYGQPVLTWWQGNTSLGEGAGEGVILDRSYRRIATVRAGNGLYMDLHEFLLTPDGHAYIDAGELVGLPGIDKPVLDSVVQEIDVKTGLVLFEWHALDHVPLSDSDFTEHPSQAVVDPYHINSIALDSDGNLIVSMRNTSGVYKVDHVSGRIIWALGGKRSSFTMGPWTSTWGQHDATVQGDGTLTLFDDGAGPPKVRPFSRGIRERLDTSNMTATLVRQFIHSPPLSANFEGSIQQLPGGETFIGWGQQPYFSEYTATGRQDFDAHFDLPTCSYRAYRFDWSGQPATPPALAVAPNADGTATVYASWNGATDVAAWRVLAGSSSNSLSPIARAPRSGFETRIEAPSTAPYFAVQALGSGGRVLATSPRVATQAHLAIFGHTAFVDLRRGAGRVAVGCFASGACAIALTVRSGPAVVARTSPQRVAASGVAAIRFQLSAQAEALLAARGRLGVQVQVKDAALSAATALSLFAFRTSGPGPIRTAGHSRALRVVALTSFVSAGWVGGLLTACAAGAPCLVRTTLTAGHTVLARTGPELLAPGELADLTFTLTAAGHRLLASAPGNQLAATATLTSRSSTLTARIALVAFG